MVQLQEDREDSTDWDSRTNTLTFHTFRPINEISQSPVGQPTSPAVFVNGHNRLNQRPKEQQITQQINGGHQRKPPPPYSHAHWLGKTMTSPTIGHRALVTLDRPPVYTYVELLVIVQLFEEETRVGFSMCGGRDLTFPSVINNILKGSPADRAGLSVGDEIIEVNGISVERSTHSEIVQHIHRCIRSRTIQLRVRRKQDKSEPQPEIATPNTEQPPTLEAYQKAFCSAESPSFNRECVRVKTQETTLPKQSVAGGEDGQYLANGHHHTKASDNPHSSGGRADRRLDFQEAEQGAYESGFDLEANALYNSESCVSDAYMISVNQSERSELAHRLQRHYPGVQTFDMETLHSHLQATEEEPVSGSISPIMDMSSSVQNSAYPVSTDINQNKTAPVKEVLRSSHQLNGNVPVNGHLSDDGDTKTSAKVGFVENGELECQTRMTRLKSYEEDLKKRKEKEERQAKEQAFLRSSLRGSKKLQALEQNDDNSSPPMEHHNEGFSHEDHLSQSPISTVDVDDVTGVNEVIESVSRLTEALEELPEHEQDSEFLRDLFSQPEVRNAIEISRSVQKEWSGKTPAFPAASDAAPCADSVVRLLGDSISDSAGKLQEILEKPNVQAVIYTHDKLVDKFHELESVAGPSAKPANRVGVHYSHSVLGLRETALDGADNLRIIKLMKQDDQYLGATVKNVGERVVVGRIVKGGVAEKTQLLKEGDEILEVNGSDLRGKSVNEVCDLMRTMTGELTFIVAAGGADDAADAEAPATPQPVVRNVRAQFDYEPEDDCYVPCRELALKFSKGEILHIISMSDDNWWQAYREGDDPATHSLAGLIPSAAFRLLQDEQRRDVLGESTTKDPAEPDAVNGLFCARRSKKAKKSGKVTHFGAQNSLPIAKQEEKIEPDVLTYEDVSLYLPRAGKKRPVVLVGPPNVGCLDLRHRLMESDKEKFAGVVPNTTRPKRPSEQDGIHYHFVSKQVFQEDVSARKFVEWGEFEKHNYGTSFHSIRQVISRGKICVLTLKAQSLRALRSSNLMPYVIFISPPSFIQLKKNLQKQNMKDDDLKAIIEEGKSTEETYRHLFDSVIVNIDLDQSFIQLRNIIHRLETEPQWVPSYWLHTQQ